jgi:transcriptional regulator with XRE-family HTH domain
METESNALPERLVTVNQVVARNIACYRREAGMTQHELADRLGWPQNKVSEAETSWKGKRTREFDAHTLTGLALALGVPLNALFLPPEDDGEGVRYLFRPPGVDEDLGMGDLMATVNSDSDDDGDAMASYRRRFLNAAGKYLEEGWQEEIASWLRPLVGPEELEEGAYRLRGQREQLLASAAWLGDMADALDKARGEEEGR